MSSYLKEVLRIAKVYATKDAFKKLKSLKSEEEIIDSARHLVINHFEGELLSLKKEVARLEEEKSFFAKSKLLLVPGKIMHLKADFNKKELERVLSVINSIKKEIENV